jgi:hypothetical protein
LGGGDLEDYGSKSATAQSPWDPISTNSWVERHMLLSSQLHIRINRKMAVQAGLRKYLRLYPKYN